MRAFILFIILAFLQSAQAQDSGQLTALDIARLQGVNSVSIHPNGSKIAYTLVSQADPTRENRRHHNHLYLYDLDSKTQQAYITGYSVDQVAFRPGHPTITFAAKKEGDAHSLLYEIAVGGGEARKLYEFSSSIGEYHWHPDGNRLAFIAKEIAKDEEGRLPYQAEVYEENLENASVFVVTLEEGKPNKIPLEGHAHKVQWDPTGQKLAISVAPTPLVDDTFMSQQIHVVDAKSLEEVSVINHKAKLGEFHWSPDGNKLAFLGGEDLHDPSPGRVFIADTGTGLANLIQKEFKGDFESISWKDKNSMYYLISEGVYSSLGILNTNGGMERLFRDDHLDLTAFSISDNNSIALLGNSWRHPSELFLFRPGSQNMERLTKSNPWLEGMTLGKQEVVHYKSQDGLELEGILVQPPNSTGNNPLITVVHGGPEAHYDNGWLTGYSSPGQLAALRGYSVFYPNYRGSTGRGTVFAKSSQGDPAGKEFDDIIDGIDHLVANYNIDKDRVGVTGGSYGGYATAWMATRHSKRFAAGVMFVGISNNLSKWGTADIPEEMFLVHSRKRIWDDYQFFLERSPIYYAGQAETPLLIMAGKEDTRVDPGQSYELYRHIKTRTDTPVRLVLYPGEGHGNVHSTARYDYNLRMMNWFDAYLMKRQKEMPENTLMKD